MNPKHYIPSIIRRPISHLIRKQPPEELPVYNNCPLCDCLLMTYRERFILPDMDWHLPSYRNQCFHTPCPNCPDLSNHPLCDVCKHMRLGHLVRCGLSGIKDIKACYKWGYFPNKLGLWGVRLAIGRIAEVRERAGECHTCATFAGNAERLGPPNGVGDDAMVSLVVVLQNGSIRGVEYDFEIRLEVGLEGCGINPAYRTSVYYGTIDVSRGKRLTAIRPSEWVDWGTVSTWLKDCDEGKTEHGTSCQAQSFTSPIELRLVDIKTKCTVAAPASPKYAALSCVWRDRDPLQVSIQKIAGSLSNDNLPMIVRDAIAACEKLDIPYLWVDRLCIFPGEERTSAIGLIYSHAYVTFIALAGSNADHGLPGVHNHRKAQWTGNTQGLYLFNEVDPYPALINRSKHSTQGWKFQEFMLSPRRILFTDVGVYYHCRGRSTYNDEDIGETDKYTPLVQTSLATYPELVEDYTRRELEVKSDIIPAFAGILDSVYGSDHYFGLPFQEFSQALLWYSGDGTYPPRPSANGHIYPSWSWCSIDNHIKMIPNSLVDWKGSFSSLAIWAIPSFDETGTTLRIIPNKSKTIRELKGWDFKEYGIPMQIAMVLAWKGGCFPEKIPDVFDDDFTWWQYENEIRKRWPSVAAICDAGQGISPDTSSIKDAETKFPSMQRACQPGHILVYTQYTHLHLVHPPPKDTESKKLNPIQLQNNNGDPIAYIIPQSQNNISPNTEYSVLALSIRYHHHSWGKKSIPFHACGGCLSKDPGSNTWFDSRGRPLTKYGYLITVFFMVVRTGEDGISRRVALAQGLLRVWIRQEREFGSFIMG